MKKFLSLVLTLCMLLAAAGAMAEAQTERVVLQDGVAPVLNTVKCADGDAYAVVYDKDGNEVAHVTDAAQIKLVDKTGSADAAGIENTALDAHSMMLEKFAVELPADVAALLTEGAYIEVAFTVADWQPLPSVVKVTAGETLADAKIVAQAGKTVTVQMPAQGVVSFLTSFEEGKAAAPAYDGVIIPSEGAAGENFTPSVSGKPAPGVVAAVDGKGDVVVAFIETLGSTELVSVADDGTLVITPVSERDYVMDVRTHGALEWAYETISTAKSLNELPAAAEIDAAVAASNLTSADLVVRDLFAVSLYGAQGEEVKAADKLLNVKFDMGIAQGTPVVTMVSTDNANWTVLSSDKVAVNADGTVTIKLDDMGVVAFAVPAEQPQQGTVTSPATGE